MGGESAFDQSKVLARGHAQVQLGGLLAKVGHLAGLAVRRRVLQPDECRARDW